MFLPALGYNNNNLCTKDYSTGINWTVSIQLNEDTLHHHVEQSANCMLVYNSTSVCWMTNCSLVFMGCWCKWLNESSLINYSALKYTILNWYVNFYQNTKKHQIQSVMNATLEHTPRHLESFFSSHLPINPRAYVFFLYEYKSPRWVWCLNEYNPTMCQLFGWKQTYSMYLLSWRIQLYSRCVYHNYVTEQMPVS